MIGRTFLPSRGSRVVSAAALGIALVVLGGKAFSAQDKYTLRVPDGLALSDFRGTRTGRSSPSVRLKIC